MALTDINATFSLKGTFRQGETVNLYAKVTDLEGTPVDPYSIICTVSGPVENGSVVEVSSGIPYKADTGFYIYSWNIEPDAGVGTYEADWEYVVNDEEIHETQTVMVTDATPSAPYFYTETWKAYRAALEHHICCAQSIPVYYEQARQSYDNKTFKFAFKNWNRSCSPRVYRNEILVSSGFEVDYDNGQVTFTNTLLKQDQINIDYNFKWFTDDDLNRFLLNSLQTINVFPPHSTYSLDSLPAKYSPAVLYGAAKDALRQLMMCLQFQQPQQVFGGSENAQKAFANMETLKQNYSKDWEKLVDQKKLGPYPTTYMVVVPEYTLPGGRCISLYTKGLCKIGESIFEATMSEVFNFYKHNYYVEILSQSNVTGNMIFAPIRHIWESGVKARFDHELPPLDVICS